MIAKGHTVVADRLSAVGAANVFGVDWRSTLPLIGFEPTSSPPDGEASILAVSRNELRAAWTDEAETIACHRSARGRPILMVERIAEMYRVRALRLGAAVIAANGRSILCAPQTGRDWRWQRLLFAQALPLGAQLQGLNMLHASAVCVRETAVAFVATAGAGKSTLAANLVARGHALLTDDVLSVSASGDGPIAHPGPPLLGLARSEYHRLPEDKRELLGRTVGHLDKLYLGTPVRRTPAPLRLVYFLTRDGVNNLEIREQRPPDPRRLLGSAFLGYLRGKSHLVGHLDFCVALATDTKVFTIDAPSDIPPDELAAHLEDHVAEQLGAS